MLEGMIAGSFSGSTVGETCAELCRKMNIQGVDLREATVGNAFSLNSNGRKVVAVSPEMVTSMSSAEVEAGHAHERSRFKNTRPPGKRAARRAQPRPFFLPRLHPGPQVR